ncbi:BTB/POZ domain-containing protein 3 [Aphelenchoides avenae]|nr:BTB/POZ domain-containing protein 3 [Aphelenchus avenae]
MVPDREAEAVLSSPQFLVVDYETLKEIIGRDTNNAGETTVYSGAVEWARMNLGGTTASDGMVRVLLGEVLYLIRFPLKSIDEFANGPAKDAILTSDEVIAGNA